jgi:hypothetical protein
VEPRIDLVQLQRTFVTPAGLDRSRPRETRLTANGVALVIAAITMLGASIVVFVLLFRQATHEADVRRNLAGHGVDAVAGVTRLWRSPGDSHQPWAAYQWSVGSLTYGGQIRLRLATWNALRVGSPLAIRYDPSDPGRSILAGTEPPALPLWVPPLASSALVVGGIACLLLLRVHRLLLRDGRAAPAIVTKRRRVSTQHGGSYLSIAYEFPLLSGATATGRSQAVRNPPAVGDVMCVVYDPDRPRRSMPYPLKLVRLA